MLSIFKWKKVEIIEADKEPRDFFCENHSITYTESFLKISLSLIYFYDL